MYAYLQSILGPYTPPTYTTFVPGLDGALAAVEVIPDGLAGVDWLYVLSGVAFLLVVYSVLRLIGGMLCKIS